MLQIFKKYNPLFSFFFFFALFILESRQNMPGLAKQQTVSNLLEFFYGLCEDGLECEHTLFRFLAGE